MNRNEVWFSCGVVDFKDNHPASESAVAAGREPTLMIVSPPFAGRVLVDILLMSRKGCSSGVSFEEEHDRLTRNITTVATICRGGNLIFFMF
jgi:hypothetical protein